MFGIKSDVITLESIEMYGFVTAWASMDDGPYWVILLMYESHKMRHTSFLQVDGGLQDPRVKRRLPIHPLYLKEGPTTG